MCFPAVLAAGAIEAGAATAAAGAATAATAAATTATATAAATAAATTAGGMTGMQMLSMVGSGLGQLMSMKAQDDQKSYEAGIARNNQLTAQYASDDAKRRAELEAQRVQRQTSDLVGKQRAAFAAKGLDVSEGTPGDIIDQSNFFGQVDANTARYNGKVEAWQKSVTAQNYGAQSSAASSSIGGAGSLLSAGGAVADKWYSYTKKAA